jgi:large subunit ribosomal protein L10
MAKTRQEKGADLELIKSDLEKAKNVIFFKGSGLLFSEQEDLRRQARDKNGKIVVYKNTLLRLASKEVLSEDVNLFGNVVCAFDYNDNLALLKDIYKKSKEKGSKVEIIGGIFDRKLADGKYTVQMATVPSLEESLSKLVYILNSPASNLARTTNEVARKLAATVDAVKEKLNK